MSYQIKFEVTAERLAELMTITTAQGVEVVLDDALAGLEDRPELIALAEYQVGRSLGVWVKGHHLSDSAMLRLIIEEIYVEAIRRGYHDELPTADEPLVIKREQWVEIETDEFENLLLPEPEDPNDVIVDGPFLVTVCRSEIIGELAQELL